MPKNFRYMGNLPPWCGRQGAGGSWSDNSPSKLVILLPHWELIGRSNCCESERFLREGVAEETENYRLSHFTLPYRGGFQQDDKVPHTKGSRVYQRITKPTPVARFHPEQAIR